LNHLYCYLKTKKMRSLFKPFALAICGALFSGLSSAGNDYQMRTGEYPSLHTINKGFKLSEAGIPHKMAEDGVFDENSRVLNIGLGFAGGSYHKVSRGSGYSSVKTPLFTIAYEQALQRKLGPGYLGVGGFFSFQNAYSRYDNVYYNGGFYYYKHNWNYYQLCARATYHVDALNWRRGEVYPGLMLGLRAVHYKYSTNNPDPEGYNYRLSEQSVYPATALLVGARWYFTERVALYGEAATGNGISYATGGFTFKF
jgi:hypothetical protein